VAGSCECGNEPLGFIKYGVTAPWSYYNSRDVSGQRGKPTGINDHGRNSSLDSKRIPPEIKTRQLKLMETVDIYHGSHQVLKTQNVNKLLFIVLNPA
jgi:hypothetical protein